MICPGPAERDVRPFPRSHALLALLAAIALLAALFVAHSRLAAVPAEVTVPLGPQTLGSAVRARPVWLAARTPIVNYGRVDERLTRLMEDPAMVGLAVAIVEDGRISYARGFGETVNGSREPVTIETVFRWASLSKGVAATMVSLLAQEGKLSLDEPVARHAPSLLLPNLNQNRATVADLLAHRLGIGRNSEDPKLEDGENPARLRMSLASLPPGCPPGTCHSYQNVAFDAASEIVARVTGASYDEALRRRLFEPLGMRTASATRTGLISAPNWARPHVGQGREVEVLEPYYRVPAAGGMNSSILDLAVWMEAQMGLASGVIAPGLLDVIHRPRVRTPREDARNRRYLGRLVNARYALGWRTYDYAGHRMIGHRGAVSGYRSFILFDPDRRTGIVGLWNSESSRPFGLAIDLFDMLYGLPDANWMRIGVPPGAPLIASAVPSAVTAEDFARQNRVGATYETVLPLSAAGGRR